MAGNIGFNSDRGPYTFGAWITKKDGPYIRTSVVQPPIPGNLLDFFGLPYVPEFNRVPPGYDWNVATLTNGAKIKAVNYKAGDGSYYVYVEYINSAGTRLLSTSNMYDDGRGGTVSIGFFTGINSQGESLYTPLGNANKDADNNWIEGRIEPKFGDLLNEPTVNAWTPDKLLDFLGDSYVPVPPPFPGPDNEKDPEGGDGEGPDAVEDEPIEFPEKPDITVTDAGLMTLYTPTQGQIHAFGDFLWSDAFSLDTFKKLFADPMQAVIGLSIVPVAVPTAGAQPITIGAISSGVTANRAASQYVVHDCGTLTVKPVWNTALDFSPYTKFSIYLPFIGTRELKTDDIMGKTLNVKYFVDVLSGACTAHISVGGSVLYQFSGSCATPVPLSAMNWNSTLTSMIQLAGAGIAMAVTGGAAAPSAAGMLTTATGMIGNKPNVQRSGAVSGAAGMLGVKTPYLIRETPRQSLAKDYAHYSGYPSNITAVLGTLKGFTVVENMHLKNIDATADELDEIETALKEGVIL